jgi:leucine zipper transcription factor-like protein 1
MQELERKFSQTGAYKNLKKMLTTKNDQIKELRQTLHQYEDLGEEE